MDDGVSVGRRVKGRERMVEVWCGSVMECVYMKGMYV